MSLIELMKNNIVLFRLIKSLVGVTIGFFPDDTNW